MDTSMNSIIMKHFPFDTPRAGQIEVLSDVITAINNGKKYIMIDADTGFGKSAIARTLCSYYGLRYDYKSFLMTATKDLQDQYERECPNIFYKLFKGRANYKCRHEDRTMCNEGYCKNKLESDRACDYGIKDGNPHDNGGCNYWEAKSDCIKSRTAILNYNVLLSDNQYINHFPTRKIMICDEAHNIEDKIRGEVSIDIAQSTIERDIDYIFDDKKCDNKDIDYWIEVLNEIATKYDDVLENNRNKMLVKDIEHYTKYAKNLKYKINTVLNDKKNFVVNITKRYLKGIRKYVIDAIQFKPVLINNYTHDLLFNSSETIIFMSGSFVDKDMFCKDLGLNVEDVYYRQNDSPFDKIHRNPINTKYARYGLTSKVKKQNMPMVIELFKDILDENPNVKGLVHCNSHWFRDEILKALGNSLYGYRLITYESYNRREQLEKFKQSDKPLVMLSYSLQEGIDLKDDLCRFQVFLKVPYPYLGDEQISARSKMNDNWYTVKTAQTIIQMWGRAMRSSSDYCQNYVLDEKFLKDKLLWKYLPIEFKRAMHNKIDNINDIFGEEAIS